MASTYQYWRLTFNGPPNGGSGNFISLVEWNFYDSDMNVLSRSGGTASASSALSGWAASQAFDGNTNTGWAPSTVYSGGTEWLQYQFSSIVTASYISLTMRHDASWWLTQAPTAFVIQGSPDGSTWTTLQTYTGVLWLYGAGQTQVFSATTVQGNVRVSQVAIEAMLQNAVAKISQVPIEVFGGADPTVKISQVPIEVLGGANPMAIISQVALEIMYPYEPADQDIMEFLLP